jgi:hydroxyacylglutathione hydrolase
LSTVVDPRADEIESYIEFSNSKGMRITHVIETHIQADHISGGRRLAEQTGAVYWLHESAETSFAFQPLINGEELVSGNVVIKILHTPGHTPESICLLVTDKTRGDEPWFLLTGDTLFVGSVGRPDLPGNAADNARILFNSLHEKIFPLPDFIEIYPAHFSGSACGKGLSGKPSSTLAFEKRFNHFLSMDEGDFVQTITTDLTEKPAEMMNTVAKNLGRG